LVERPLGRLARIALAVLFRSAGAILRGAFETLLRLVDVTDDGGEDRLRERPADLAGAGNVALRKVRHAAGVVGCARGGGDVVAAVEVLARPGWDRPSDPGREQDTSDCQSQSPFHAAVPLSGRVGCGQLSRHRAFGTRRSGALAPWARARWPPEKNSTDSRRRRAEGSPPAPRLYRRLPLPSTGKITPPGRNDAGAGRVRLMRRVRETWRHPRRAAGGRDRAAGVGTPRGYAVRGFGFLRTTTTS